MSMFQNIYCPKGDCSHLSLDAFSLPQKKEEESNKRKENKALEVGWSGEKEGKRRRKKMGQGEGGKTLKGCVC